MYEPIELKNAYENVEHGKARTAAIRSAIEAADREKDVPYQIYFREELCKESCFYGDGMDMMIMFPEILSIVDRNPDAELTHFDAFYYRDNMDHMLWIYKWILEGCSSFYQIPMEDCMRFFADFKARSLAYGYSLRPYYLYRYYFYESVDEAVAEEAFYEFEKSPRDENSDCAACERNAAIRFYLKKGNLQKAEELSKDIEDFTLTCSGDMDAWLRLKKHYMEYYMRRKEFDKAAEYCRIMERNMNEKVEYQRWDDFLCCYASADMGKALKIYKKHWKEWQEERKPWDRFFSGKNICCFFRKLKEEKGGNTIKLSLDASFPLYQESGQYEIDTLYQYYYDRTRELAEKFDARNGTDHYSKELKEAVGD